MTLTYKLDLAMPKTNTNATLPQVEGRKKTLTSEHLLLLSSYCKEFSAVGGGLQSLRHLKLGMFSLVNGHPVSRESCVLLFWIVQDKRAYMMKINTQATFTRNFKHLQSIL